MLNVRAHQQERIEQFEHTRAICYFIAIQYMGTNRVTMEEFWSLPTDETSTANPEDMLAYMRKVQAEYDRVNQVNNG